MLYVFVFVNYVTIFTFALYFQKRSVILKRFKFDPMLYIFYYCSYYAFTFMYRPLSYPFYQ